MNEALRDWVATVHDTFYIIGTAAGPHPYPELVRDFQSVIGTETRAQILKAEGRLPDLLVAAVGGGSNAIGLFHPFLDDTQVAMLGIEAAGRGIAIGRSEEHTAELQSLMRISYAVSCLNKKNNVAHRPSTTSSIYDSRSTTRAKTKSTAKHL